MKKITAVNRFTILLSLLFLPFTANAAGLYDGVWELLVPGVSGLYGSIHQSGDTIVLVGLDDDDEDGAWSAYMGQLQGTEVELSTVISGHGTTLVYYANFTSATTIEVTQLSCTPVNLCDALELPNNFQISAVKIF